MTRSILAVNDDCETVKGRNLEKRERPMDIRSDLEATHYSYNICAGIMMQSIYNSLHAENFPTSLCWYNRETYS